MHLAYRYGTMSLIIEEMHKWPIYAAFGPYPAPLEKLVDARSLGMWLAGYLFEGGAEVMEVQARAARTLADETGRQWNHAGTYLGLFYAPFRLYRGGAVSDEAGRTTCGKRTTVGRSIVSWR